MQHSNGLSFVALTLIQRFSKYEARSKEKGFLQNNDPLLTLTLAIQGFFRKTNEEQSREWGHRGDSQASPDMSGFGTGEDSTAEQEFIRNLERSFQRIFRDKSHDTQCDYPLFISALNFAHCHVDVFPE